MATIKRMHWPKQLIDGLPTLNIKVWPILSCLSMVSEPTRPIQVLCVHASS